MAKQKKNELTGFAKLQAQLTKKFGDTITDWDSLGKVPRYPTNAYKLDKALGGGIPKGRVIEVYGAESSGKTSLATFIAGVIQRAGGHTAYIDSEHAIDPEYAITLGYDPKKSIFAQPDSAEEALNLALDIAESGEIRLIVIDSVATLAPQAEIDGEMGDATIALVARLMSKFLRKITPLLKQNDCTLLLINQERTKIGGYAPHGNIPLDTTGGKAIKYYSSIRIKVSRGDSVRKGTEDIGMISKVKMMKNKTAPPFQTCEMKVIFHHGYQTEADWVDACIDYDFIVKAGGWYSIPLSEEKFQGREKLEAYLHENPAVFEELKDKAKKALAGDIEENSIEEEEIEVPDSDDQFLED